MDAKSAIKLAQVASGEPAYKTAARLGMTQAAYSSLCRGLTQVDRLALVAQAIGWRLVLTDGSTSLDILPERDPAATDGRTQRAIEEKKKRKEKSTTKGH